MRCDGGIDAAYPLSFVPDTIFLSAIQVPSLRNNAGTSGNLETIDMWRHPLLVRSRQRLASTSTKVFDWNAPTCSPEADVAYASFVSCQRGVAPSKYGQGISRERRVSRIMVLRQEPDRHCGRAISEVLAFSPSDDAVLSVAE